MYFWLSLTWELFGHATINGSDLPSGVMNVAIFNLLVGYKLVMLATIYIVGYNILNYYIIWIILYDILLSYVAPA